MRALHDILEFVHALHNLVSHAKGNLGIMSSSQVQFCGAGRKALLGIGTPQTSRVDSEAGKGIKAAAMEKSVCHLSSDLYVHCVDRANPATHSS